MDCFGTYFTHAQSCDNVHVQSAKGMTASVHTHAQSCDNVHVQSATDWAASVHTLHMPKAVIKFVFEVYGMDCWRTYLHMPKSVITFVFKVLRNGLCFRRFRVFAVFAFSFFPVSVLGVFAFSRFRVPPAAPPRPGHRFRVHRINGASHIFWGEGGCSRWTPPISHLHERAASAWTLHGQLCRSPERIQMNSFTCSLVVLDIAVQ